MTIFDSKIYPAFRVRVGFRVRDLGLRDLVLRIKGEGFRVWFNSRLGLWCFRSGFIVGLQLGFYLSKAMTPKF